MTRDEIFIRLRDLLAQSFNIDPARITPEARLMEDLDLDSIDAIDMVVQLQEWTGRHVPEEALRSIRTVNEVVTMVENHLAQSEGAGAGGDPPPQTGGPTGGPTGESGGPTAGAN
ncbi:MAG: acyl carrier protein [Bacteroidota bacterium]